MLTITLNTADFFLCGGFYLYECSTLLLLVSPFMKKASACLVVSARLLIIPCYTRQHFSFAKVSDF